MLSAALSTLTVGCTDNCEGPGGGAGGGGGGGGHQVQNNDFQIVSRAASPMSAAQPHYHMKRHRRTFSFSPSDCSPQSCWGWGAGGTPSSPPVINSGAQSPGRRNLTVYPGAIFDYSEWLAVSQSMPWQMTPRPRPSPSALSWR